MYFHWSSKPVACVSNTSSPNEVKIVWISARLWQFTPKCPCCRYHLPQYSRDRLYLPVMSRMAMAPGQESNHRRLRPPHEEHRQRRGQHIDLRPHAVVDRAEWQEPTGSAVSKKGSVTRLPRSAYPLTDSSTNYQTLVQSGSFPDSLSAD